MQRVNNETEPNMDEDIKLFIHGKISEFLNSQVKRIEFPESLTKAQRAYVHQYSQSLGMSSCSHGKDPNRKIVVYKRLTAVGNQQQSVGRLLSGESRQVISKLLASPGPMTLLERTSASISQHGSLGARNLNREFIPPKSRVSEKMMIERSTLPIFKHRSEILHAIGSEQVIIINGETGSGKTTQVPQYILEQANLNRVPCRIICTQPRRIAAVTIAERVAQERYERLGTTVGYQIRLENCFEYNTNLIYATSGCMIRALMTDADQTLQGLTHIIIDEIHERDKNTDFLLITLRDQLVINKNLKVLLMSATMDIELLSGYFANCSIINVPGRCYETRIFFLEHILFYTKYKTMQMRELLKNWQLERTAAASGKLVADITEKIELDEKTRNLVDDLIVLCCDRSVENAEYFDQLIYLIEGEGVPVDVQHSFTKRTPLIAAAITNNFEYLHRLLLMKADESIVDMTDRSALDYAETIPDQICYEYLSDRKSVDDCNREMERILLSYQRQFYYDEDEIDHNLLLELLITINRSEHQGSILVFLPGYNDMITQKELIQRQLQSGSYKLFLMHSNMNTNDQRMALKQFDVRKIVLATNIAETSITFPDVAFVVDTGKVKQNTYDTVTGSTALKLVPISKACAMQRAGRAGRTQTGICYRLYSTAKYEAMENFTIAEFLRIPLTEICLYAKVINKGTTSIATYLSKALQPPTKVSILNAVQHLIMIGALDKDENITVLGKRLVDMPLDVQLGKSLLCAILLRCVDPVLTIVAYHSVKDPFLLPSDRMERERVSRKRKELCEDFYSDHLGIIKLYQKWRQSRQIRGAESEFLSDYNLSRASLEVMFGVRQQILDHVKRSSLPDGMNITSLNTNSNDWNLIRACLTSGLYPNVAYIDRTKRTIVTRLEKSIMFHATSILRAKDTKTAFDRYPSNWIIFNETACVANTAQIKHNTFVPPINIALFCGRIDMIKPSDDFEQDDYSEGLDPVIAADDWIKFDISPDEHSMISQFKERFTDVFMQFLSSGRRWRSDQYVNFINALKNILAIEDPDSFGTKKSPFEDNYQPRRYDKR